MKVVRVGWAVRLAGIEPLERVHGEPRGAAGLPQRFQVTARLRRLRHALPPKPLKNLLGIGAIVRARGHFIHGDVGQHLRAGRGVLGQKIVHAVGQRHVIARHAARCLRAHLPSVVHWTGGGEGPIVPRLITPRIIARDLCGAQPSASGQLALDRALQLLRAHRAGAVEPLLLVVGGHHPDQLAGPRNRDAPTPPCICQLHERPRDDCFVYRDEVPEPARGRLSQLLGDVLIEVDAAPAPEAGAREVHQAKQPRETHINKVGGGAQLLQGGVHLERLGFAPADRALLGSRHAADFAGDEGRAFVHDERMNLHRDLHETSHVSCAEGRELRGPQRTCREDAGMVPARSTKVKQVLKNLSRILDCGGGSSPASGVISRPLRHPTHHPPRRHARGERPGLECVLRSQRVNDTCERSSSEGTECPSSSNRSASRWSSR